MSRETFPNEVLRRYWTDGWHWVFDWFPEMFYGNDRPAVNPDRHARIRLKHFMYAAHVTAMELAHERVCPTGGDRLTRCAYRANHAWLAAWACDWGVA